MSPLSLCLGIDFGTKYTKVCFRDLGRSKSKILVFRGQGASVDDALIPSVLYCDVNGRYHVGTTELIDNADFMRIEYIKMRLASLDLGHTHAIPQYRPIEEGAHNQDLMTEAFCAFFLSQVVRSAQDIILRSDRELIAGREVGWIANIGVPVEYFDSPAIKRFRKVFAAAWIMATERELIGQSATLDTIIHVYQASSDTDPDSQNFIATPEIGAAVQSFLTTRTAQEGVYVYFDIGAGTLDGVSFRYYSEQGVPKVSFYSGKVEPLGINALAVKLSEINPLCPLKIYEEQLYKGEIRLTNVRLTELRTKIQRQVAEVIMQGKRLDRHGFTNPLLAQHLPIFVGGGGSMSPCYRDTIKATHHDFNHSGAGILPYHLQSTPLPLDLDMNNLPEESYHRFNVAYGLTPVGDLAEFRLPSQMSEEAYKERWQQFITRETCRFCPSRPMPNDYRCFSCSV